MNQHESEADARIVIDTMLRQAGWDPADKSQVRAEVTVTENLALHDRPMGLADEEEDGAKRTDYILLASNGRPLAVAEAKRKRIDPYSAKQQTLPLAIRTLPANPQ